MKTSVKMAMMAAVMMMGVNFAMAAPKAPSVVTEPQVCAESHIYFSEKDKTPIRYVYTVDEDGRVSSRVKYEFSREDKMWKPCYIYRAQYGEDANTIVYAAWNSNTSSFSRNIETHTYSVDECPVLLALPQRNK